MRIITTICTECKKKFEKSVSHFNRCKRQGWKHFCCHKCRIAYTNSNLTEEQRIRRNELFVKNRFIPQSNEFSPFKVFSKKVRQTDVIRRYGRSNLDAEYLKKLWDAQNGKCAYTGITMVLPPTIREYHNTHSLKKLSLDRIDSSKGYLKGNVHFVCQAINLAKRNLPHDEMVALIEEIKNAGNNPGAAKIGGATGN